MTGTELPDFPASQLFLRRLAYRLVRDEGLAEDLVQDTWTAWVRHRPRGLADPRAWLARVLRNHAFNARRAADRRASRERAAARPDPGEPETDGTLAAQAHLVAALRELAEPYRSTLLQRYYHDLTPREIAERTGTPLETVRSRLARGLARLREELDRRHGGDRAAWCHWLAAIGDGDGAAAPPPAARATGPRATPGVPRAGVVSGGAGALVTWSGVLASLVCAIALVAWSARGSRGPRETADRPVPELARRPMDLVGALVTERAPEPRPEPPPAATPPPPERPAATRTDPRPRLWLEWPQLLGNAQHAPRHHERMPSPRLPRVEWHVVEAAGAPTASGGDVYAGGPALLRVDPLAGVVVAAVPDASGEDAFVAAPALTDRLVLARRARDGAVQAYTRDLASVVWTWTPARPVRDPWPGCLAGELLLVASGDEVVALRTADGDVAWRFRAEDEGEIDMTPAASGHHAYFASDAGIVSGVSLERGTRRMRFETGGWIAGFPPLVLADGPEEVVLIADRGSALLRPGSRVGPEEEVWPGKSDRSGVLWALSAYSRREVWRTSYGATAISPLALAPGEILAGVRDRVERFAMVGGARGERPIRTGRGPYAAPVVLGGTVVAGTHEGTLEARALADGALRWAFRLPPDERVEAVVPAPPRLLAATSIGLFCIGEDAGNPALAQDYLLDWTAALALEVAREQERRRALLEREAAAEEPR